MSKAKEEAEAIFNDHYCSILEHGEELSEEIVISLLAKKSALIHVKGIIKELELTLKQYNFYSTLIASRVTTKDRLKFMHEVKQELKNM